MTNTKTKAETPKKKERKTKEAKTNKFLVTYINAIE